jgi:hypothetical protein
LTTRLLAAKCAPLHATAINSPPKFEQVPSRCVESNVAHCAGLASFATGSLDFARLFVPAALAAAIWWPACISAAVRHLPGQAASAATHVRTAGKRAGGNRCAGEMGRNGTRHLGSKEKIAAPGIIDYRVGCHELRPPYIV